MSEESKGGEVVPKLEYEQLREKHTQVAGKLTDFEKQFERVSRLGGLDKIAADLEAFNLLQEERAKEKPEDLKAWKTEAETKIRSTIQQELDGYKTKATSAENKFKELAIVEKTFGAAASKLVQAAHEDFKVLARQHGDLDDKGNIIYKDAQGNVLYKEGSTTEPLDSEGFVSWAAKNKPHYFSSQTVSGDRDGQTSTDSGSGSSITVDQYFQMSAAEHAKLPLAVRADLAKKARQGRKV